MLLYSPDHADRGMEAWSRLYENTYRPSYAHTILQQMRAADARKGLLTVLRHPYVVANLSLFLGSMTTYFTLASVNKVSRRRLVGTSLAADAAGNRPWAWTLRRALPCVYVQSGDIVAGQAAACGQPTRPWLTFLPGLPTTQRHACLLVQTPSLFRVIVVVKLHRRRLGGRDRRESWPTATVCAVLSSVDGSDTAHAARIGVGSTVSVQVMLSLTGRRHLYLCLDPRLQIQQPLIIVQLSR